jgi:hypothetical protein
MNPETHMSQDTTYNGYKNYETWNVHLWLSNDQGSDDYWREQAEEVCKDARDHENVSQKIWTPQQVAKFALADMLKEQIGEANPLEDDEHQKRQELGMWRDLLGAALSEVDWHEIADAYLDDLDEYKALAKPLPFTYTIDLDERGDFKAHVDDGQGETVFSIGTEDGASLAELIEDGFIKHGRDLAGLADYLKHVSIMTDDDRLEADGL